MKLARDALSQILVCHQFAAAAPLLLSLTTTLFAVVVDNDPSSLLPLNA